MLRLSGVPRIRLDHLRSSASPRIGTTSFSFSFRSGQSLFASTRLTKERSMSTLDLSLPSRPVAAASSSSSGSGKTRPSLLARLGPSLPAGLAGLPAKPNFAPPPPSRPPSSSTPRPLLDSYSPERSRSPPAHRYERDVYIPRSPPPPRLQEYRPRSPERREDWDRRDTYVAHRSPSPPPVRSSRRRSPSFSRSPTKNGRSPSPDLPKSFFTRSHIRAEEAAQKAEQRRLEAEKREEARRLKEEERAAARIAAREAAREKKRKEEDEAWSAYRHERGEVGDEAETLRKFQEERWLARDKLYSTSPLKRPAPTGPSSSNPSKLPRAAPSGPKTGVFIPGAPTGPRKLSGLSGTPRGPRGAPTGPRAMESVAAFSTSSHLSAQPNPKPSSPQLSHYLSRRAVSPASSNASASSSASRGKVSKSTKRDFSNPRGDPSELLRQPSSSPKPQGEREDLDNEAATIELTDGTTVSYDRARQFMEYYCVRYKFGKPDIEFQGVVVKRKSSNTRSKDWDAVMSVGGRRIGMGQGPTKKAAQVKCYLDVTQYLESCDPGLWKDYLETNKGVTDDAQRARPHLVFQMSDKLNEEIWGLCADIRQSKIYQSAPKSGEMEIGSHQMPAWMGNRRAPTLEVDLQRKSELLKTKLVDYEADPQLQTMRNQRASLPVSARSDELLQEINNNDVTIVMAATGSGKTTQIPQIILDDAITRGEGAKCNILCTQPRRLAAMSVSERIADERGQRLGDQVGYHIRFDPRLPQPNGSITFCTTGIFLKRMQSSLGPTANSDSVAAMDEITHVIVDEVHERDIDTDLSLVVLKRLLAERKARGKPLKVILMSATIDPSLFQRYFASEQGLLAPVANVPGRTFPVTRQFLDDIVPEIKKAANRSKSGAWVFDDRKVSDYLLRELSGDTALFGPNTGTELDIPYPLVALTIAHILKKSDDGHLLVFLPGWEEIKKVSAYLLDPAKAGQGFGINFGNSSKYSVHYLHSSVPAAEQREVFNPPPPGVRRIILSTNIAETSVTIPDIVYVVDAGRVKENRFDPARRMKSLVTGWVSKSNLNQRAGRAGRHREGEYYSLLSNMRHDSLDSHQLVEMKREDLSSVVMHVKALNLGEVENVLQETIEPPEADRVHAAMDSLHMLGALDEDRNLTALGRVLLQVPIDPALGKLLLFGSFFRCLDSALTLAAVLANRDPFLIPPDIRSEATKKKDAWADDAFRSDPMTVVKAFNEWAKLDSRGQWREAADFCYENLLAKSTMGQIKMVRRALLQSINQTGIVGVSAGGSIHRLRHHGDIPAQLNSHGESLPLMAALIAMASAPNFAIRISEKRLRTATDKSVMISGSSVNSKSREFGGPDEPSASFNPAERRLYAFAEKSRSIPLGSKEKDATTSLRTVTRLDPMTYMLFGAYHIEVTKRGLECDSWLPVSGNLYALDDIQRLKTLLDTCMLRVFEGVGKSLIMTRDERSARRKEMIHVSHEGSSRIPNAQEDESDGDEEKENESDSENEVDGEAMTSREERKVEPLERDEIRELEMLTTDVVRILDAYATERGVNSANNSRAGSPEREMGSLYD